MEANKKNASGGRHVQITQQSHRKATQQEVKELRNETRKARRRVEALTAFLVQFKGVAAN